MIYHQNKVLCCNILFLYKQNFQDYITRTSLTPQEYREVVTYIEHMRSVSDGINIGTFLNSSSNSFYSWYSSDAKNMIQKTTYNRYTSGFVKDYSNLNNSSSMTYPNTTNDGDIEANVVLPTWGEMYTGNDLNYNYWYINRWPGSSSSVSNVNSNGHGDGYCAGNPLIAVRPVVTLKSIVKISSGEGTMTNPYSLSI